MDWLKNILSGVFSTKPDGFNNGTPMRSNILMFNDLNQNRLKNGLPEISPDYYASTYLPGAYKDTMGYRPGVLDGDRQRQIMNNPYLNNLYNEVAPQDIMDRNLLLY